MAVGAYLYPDKRGRTGRYLDVSRLRTFGGEGVLAKLFRVEDRALEKTADKWAEWAAKKPTPAEIAEFQGSIAAEAYETLRKEFAVLPAQGGSGVGNPHAIAKKSRRNRNIVLISR